MTDKQIIIDGCDMNGCVHLDAGIGLYFCSACNPEHDTVECKDEPNCHYKNWQRKEQECERLKSALKKKTDEYNKLTVNYDACVSMANKQLDQLKAENDKLERQIEVERKDNYSVRGQLGEAECLLCRYDRTLTEIKKIANKFDYWNSNLSQASEILLEIIEKISECEGNDE